MSLVLGSWCRPRIVLLAEGFIPGAWDEDFIDGLPTAFLLLDFGTGVAFLGGSKRQREVGLPSRKRENISHQTRKGHSFQKCPGNKDMLVPSGVGLSNRTCLSVQKREFVMNGLNGIG